jgi:class 3 adenylate cyclase
MLNERQDYFGQTVNIASRVQHLASSQAIYATGAVVGHAATAQLLTKEGVSPVLQRQTLRGIGDSLAVYEIP